jgi:catechol 2,3-dioxygenase-like lactoylglutathione lyase family enzyme
MRRADDFSLGMTITIMGLAVLGAPGSTFLLFVAPILLAAGIAVWRLRRDDPTGLSIRGAPVDQATSSREALLKGADSPPVIVGIDHVQLAMPPGREAEARGFYGGLLGIPEIPKPKELAARGGAWFESGPLKIHLGVEADFRPARKAHPGVLVADLAALLRRLRESGYEVAVDDVRDGTERAYVHDPFGNRLELIQAGAGGEGA